MDRRSALGVAIFALSIAAFFVYAYLLMLSEWSPIVMQLSMLMVAGGVLGAISWIGYTMATTRKIPSIVVPMDDEDERH
ncbi:MAG: transcriptional regulator [Thaumarchaeota archaeon]|nr:transcriptional regulator [Nitrososphaerota archaeon]RNJ73195.1 MAG: transcriptional regulator [Thaumarchaeota archaeon S13]RNJ74044.1 MAG: transcriptional regulator [Thaumarchaeota archaeon S14]MDD9808605.1 transcriptional regulator [Nitrososphaerota archaeon]MDD9813727.1 transcriptional regulator [Nitrososphaerota archaeon]